MSKHRSFAAGLWLLTAAGAYGVGAAWADGAHTSKVHPWVLIALFWGLALVSVAIHHLSLHLARASDALKAYWRDRAAHRAHLRARARLLLGRLSVAVRSTLAELEGRLGTARASLSPGWNAVKQAWSQYKAEVLRAPGVLIGWSRSAFRARRAA